MLIFGLGDGFRFSSSSARDREEARSRSSLALFPLGSLACLILALSILLSSHLRPGIRILVRFLLRLVVPGRHLVPGAGSGALYRIPLRIPSWSDR